MDKSDQKLVLPNSKLMMSGLIEELKLYQVELETQNEQLKESQAFLENSLKKYSCLFDFSPVPYILLNKQGVILNANQATELLLLKNQAFLAGLPFLVYLDKLSHALFFKHLARTFETNTVQKCELNLKLNKSFSIVVRLESALFNSEPDSQQAMTAIIDISIHKQYEKQIGVNLEKQKEINKLKSNMVHLVSHEFMSPLSTILTSANIMENQMQEVSGFDATLKKHTLKIKSTVNNLFNSLNNIHSIAKVQSGIIKHDPANFNLVSLGNELVKEFGRERLIKHMHSGENTICFIDRKLLKICVFSLLNNAIKYSGDKTDIELKTEIIPGEKVIISVKDYGIGIPESCIQYISNYFYRGKNTSGYNGNGLGLSLTKDILKVMNGILYFESKVNKYSIFVIELPHRIKLKK